VTLESVEVREVVGNAFKYRAVGLIWADTIDLAGGFAVVTNIVGAVGIVLLTVAHAMTRGRRRS
jgi:hypothetical protein